MENNQIAQEIIKKKISDFDTSDSNNFVMPQEITVTITLNEYRELLISHARTDNAIRVWRSKLSEAYQKANSLEKENAMLVKKIMRMEAGDTSEATD